MKFRKLIFGLAATPLLLASCSNSLSYSVAKQWVNDHYNVSSDKPSVASVSWDYHGSKGDTAIGYAKNIFSKINEETASELKWAKGVLPMELINISTSGERINVDQFITVPQLNANNFDSVYKEEDTKNVYKVVNGTFSGTYTYAIPYEDGGQTVDTTCIRVYNKKGYCTDFGCKVSGKRLDADNTIKLKLLLHFTYADDPID